MLLLCQQFAVYQCLHLRPENEDDCVHLYSKLFTSQSWLVEFEFLI